MTTLVSYAFQAVVRCEHCRELVSFGWVSFTRCQLCEKVLSPLEFWTKFGVPQALQAIEVPRVPHQHRDEHSALSYQRTSPACHKCKTTFEPRDFTEDARTGWLNCSQCKAQISVRELSGADDGRASLQARWVLHETFQEHSPPRNVLFACLSCGGWISVDGSARILECASCQHENFIPGALWRHFHPARQEHPFFVVYQFRHDPRFELRSRHPNADIRRVAAEMLAPPEALSNAFYAETDQVVLESLARNPNCPPETLRALSKKIFARVREYTAKHPNTPLLALELLALDGVASVQRAAREHPLYCREQQRKLGVSPQSQAQTSEEPEIPSTKLIFQELPFDADPYRSAPAARRSDEIDSPPLLLPPGSARLTRAERRALLAPSAHGLDATREGVGSFFFGGGRLLSPRGSRCPSPPLRSDGSGIAPPRRPARRRG